MNLSFLMKNESSDVINSLIDDANTIATKSLIPLTKCISAISMFVIGVIYIVSINWVLTLIIMPLGLITAILNWVTQERFFKNAQEKKGISASLWKSFSEILKGIIPIRIYKRETYYQKPVNEKIEKMRDVSVKQSRLEKTNYFVANALFMISIGIILTASAIMVSKGMMLIGGMVAILMYNHMITDPLISILETKQLSADIRVSLKRIMDFLAVKDDENRSIKRADVDEILLNEIGFSYVKNANESILKNITFKIAKNDKLAIIGETGSGKSTLVKLIAGLFSPDMGRIEYYRNGRIVDYFPKMSYLYQGDTCSMTAYLII